MTLAELQSDLESARELLANPPTGPFPPLNVPAAVAAGALRLSSIAGEAVPFEDLVWSAQVLVEVAQLYASASPEHEFSLYTRGPDRAAARGFPLILLPSAAELRAELGTLGITRADLTAAARWMTSSSPNETRLLYAQAMDLTWRAGCDHANPAKCHHGRAIELLEDSARDCVMGSWDVDRQKTRTERLDGPLEAALASVADDKLIVPRFTAAIRALSVAANTPSCCTARAEALLAALLAAHRRSMATHEHEYFQSASDTLVAARALLVEVANGKEDLLRTHVEHYVDHGRLLGELLRALAAAAEENPTAAQAARGVWPKLIDQVLDLISAGHRPRGHQCFASAGIAALMPTRSHQVYLWRELEAEPIGWPDVFAWRKQVERWLPVAAGSGACIDSLVGLLGSLTKHDQVATGLPWMEALVESPPDEDASKSWLLPGWLRQVRPHVQNHEKLTCWQRIVDRLVVGGDRRVADLSD